MTRIAALAALALAFPLLAGCGDMGPAGAVSTAIRIDTLPGGVIRVANPSGGLWSEGEEWRLVEDLRIGSREGSEAELFGSVSDLEIDGLGRIWVVDQEANEVRIFDADGGHVRTLGGTGGGPGEFRIPFRIVRDSEGRMWVADVMNARSTVFDTAGAVIETHRRPVPGGALRPLQGFDGEGRILESLTVFEEGVLFEWLVRLDPELIPADTFAVPRHDPELRAVGMMRTVVPFSPTLSVAVTPDHHLWLGISDAFRLVKTNLEGDTLRIVERPWEPEPVTERDREEGMESVSRFLEIGGEMAPRDFPSVKPAFDRILVDEEGAPWVAPFQVLQTGRWDRFHVFDPEGRYLGKAPVDPPLARSRAVVFRGDHVYAVDQDELDVPYVVRYRVERGGR